MVVDSKSPKEIELTDEVVRSMSIGAVFKDYNARINSLDFHRKEDLLVTASDDESIRLYNTANAKCEKIIHSKKYGVDQICFTHHASSVIYSSKNGWDESLRYLSLFDNRYLRYFKGHRDKVVSLCLSPKDDFFISGSLDHTIRMWDLKSNVCQGLMHVRGRPSVAFDEQGVIFAVAMDRGVLKLFDVRTYSQGPFATHFTSQHIGEFTSVKFANDGKNMLLTSSSGTILIMDSFSGNQLHQFSVVPDADGAPLEASFTPDGKYIIAGSGDGTLRVRSTSSGEQIAAWGNHAGVPAVVKWAPRRAMFASASVLLSLWIPDFSRISSTEEPLDEDLKTAPALSS